LSGLRLIESVTPFVSKSSRLLTEDEARSALVSTFGIVVDESEEKDKGGSRVIFHDSRGFFAPAFAASTYGAGADEDSKGAAAAGGSWAGKAASDGSARFGAKQKWLGLTVAVGVVAGVAALLSFRGRGRASTGKKG
jgi:hypothetical protein